MFLLLEKNPLSDNDITTAFKVKKVVTVLNDPGSNKEQRAKMIRSIAVGATKEEVEQRIEGVEAALAGLKPPKDGRRALYLLRSKRGDVIRTGGIMELRWLAEQSVKDEWARWAALGILPPDGPWRGRLIRMTSFSDKKRSIEVKGASRLLTPREYAAWQDGVSRSSKLASLI